jgi:hypothetical protein
MPFDSAGWPGMLQDFKVSAFEIETAPAGRFFVVATSLLFEDELLNRFCKSSGSSGTS